MEEKITIGSGNVYDDLDFSHPEEWQAKAQLASAILSIIQERSWTQAQTASYLGTQQVEISNIKRGQFDRFTLDRLMGYLRKLNSDVEITVKPRKDHETGHLEVICV